MSDWADQVSREGDRYRSELREFSTLINGNKILRLIHDSVVDSAAERSLNAGYSGSWSDGGAGDSVREFKAFLQGVQFAETGKAGRYQELVDQFHRAQDPEYKKYLELKEKFGDTKK